LWKSSPRFLPLVVEFNWATCGRGSCSRPTGHAFGRWSLAYVVQYTHNAVSKFWPRRVPLAASRAKAALPVDTAARPLCSLPTSASRHGPRRGGTWAWPAAPPTLSHGEASPARTGWPVDVPATPWQHYGGRMPDGVGTIKSKAWQPPMSLSLPSHPPPHHHHQASRSEIVLALLFWLFWAFETSTPAAAARAQI